MWRAVGRTTGPGVRGVQDPGRGSCADRAMVCALQHGASAQLAGLSAARTRRHPVENTTGLSSARSSGISRGTRHEAELRFHSDHPTEAGQGHARSGGRRVQPHCGRQGSQSFELKILESLRYTGIVDCNAPLAPRAIISLKTLCLHTYAMIITVGPETYQHHKDGYAELSVANGRLRDPTREDVMSDNKATEKESVLTDKEEFSKKEGNNPQDHKPVSDMDKSSPTKTKTDK